MADPIYLSHWSKKLFKTNFFFFYIQQKSPFENFTNSRIKIIFFRYFENNTFWSLVYSAILEESFLLTRRIKSQGKFQMKQV